MNNAGRKSLTASMGHLPRRSFALQFTQQLLKFLRIIYGPRCRGCSAAWRANGGGAWWRHRKAYDVFTSAQSQGLTHRVGSFSKAVIMTTSIPDRHISSVPELRCPTFRPFEYRSQPRRFYCFGELKRDAPVSSHQNLVSSLKITRTIAAARLHHPRPAGCLCVGEGKPAPAKPQLRRKADARIMSNRAVYKPTRLNPTMRTRSTSRKKGPNEPFLKGGSRATASSLRRVVVMPLVSGS